MNKINRKISLVLFTVAYTFFLSLGMACLLGYIGTIFALSLDSNIRYPRFSIFCIIVGLLSLVMIVCLALLNYKFSEKLKCTGLSTFLTLLCSFGFSLPLVNIWSAFFDFLSKTF